MSEGGLLIQVGEENIIEEIKVSIQVFHDKERKAILSDKNLRSKLTRCSRQVPSRHHPDCRVFRYSSLGCRGIS